MDNSTAANSSNATPTLPSAAATMLLGGVLLEERYFQFACYTVCGTFGLVGNLAMAVGVCRSKSTRSRFYIIMVLLFIARMCMSIQFLSMIIYRMLKIFEVVQYPPRWACSAICLFALSGTFETVILTALAVDRCIALFAVAFYRRLSRKSVVQGCTLATLIVIAVKVGMTFDDPLFTTTVTCFSIYEGTGPVGSNFGQYLELSALIVLLAIYLVMIVALQIRVHAMKNSPANEANETAVKRQMALMPTLRNIVVTHSFFTLGAKIVFTLAVAPMCQAYAGRLVLYGGCFTESEQVTNVLVLFFMNADLRAATLWKNKPNSVASVVSVTKTTTKTVKPRTPQ